jgi:hypothetical protein
MSFQITTFVHGGVQAGVGSSQATPAFNAVTGNSIIVAVSLYGPEALPSVPTDTALNTYTLIGTSPTTPTVNVSQTNIWFYYSNNITGNASNVITSSIASGTNGYWQVVAWQISGAASGNPINTFQIGGGTTGSNAQTTAALTTTVVNTIVLAYGSTSNTGTTFTAGTGYTIEIANSDDGGLSGCEYQQFTSIQTGIVPAITCSDSTHKWQMMAVAVAAPSVSNNYSVPDCRNYGNFPNTAVTTNGTKLYTGQTSSNVAIPPTDSRAAGAPTASGTYPQNSRAPGVNGPNN